MFCLFLGCNDTDIKKIDSSIKNEKFNINEYNIMYEYEYEKLLKLNEKIKIYIMNERIENELKKDKNYFNSILKKLKYLDMMNIQIVF